MPSSVWSSSGRGAYRAQQPQQIGFRRPNTVLEHAHVMQTVGVVARSTPFDIVETTIGTIQLIETKQVGCGVKK
jgi:hypothetical protein